MIRAQHDPEDEPVVRSLDSEYFEFDSKKICAHRVSALYLTCCPIAVHKDDLSKDQLKGTQVNDTLDDPAS